jgi:hypothetical protein
VFYPELPFLQQIQTLFQDYGIGDFLHQHVGANSELLNLACGVFGFALGVPCYFLGAIRNE